MPNVIWLTGLSGAGKTTLAQGIQQHYTQQSETQQQPCVVLDGDQLRQGICRDLGFCDTGRRLHIERVTALALLLTQQGVIVVVALISPEHEARLWMRQQFKQHGVRVVLVHVATPLAICQQRDPKHLYRAARHGTIRHMAGVHYPYETPTDADICIDTSHLTMDEACQQLIRALKTYTSTT